MSRHYRSVANLANPASSDDYFVPSPVYTDQKPPPPPSAKVESVKVVLEQEMEPAPVMEESVEEQHQVDAIEEDQVDGGQHRRPSPPSFLKHLSDELQLEEPVRQLQSPNQSFHYSKQHTGLKNLSFNVGAAVMPSAKMEFDEEQPESFGVVKINRQMRKMFPTPLVESHRIIGLKKHVRLDVPKPERLMASKSAENLTDQGYLDLKFYHNKLW